MLIKTISEIKELLPVSSGVELARLKPHLAIVERDFIRPLLGSAMFDELQEFYDAELPEELTQVQEAMKSLLKQVQEAELHLCYWLGFDILNAYVSDGGFKRVETEKVKSLYKYQEDELKDYFKSSGFNALDTILEFLEDNIKYFAEFELSETWKGLKGLFIHDTRTFGRFYYIGNSRLTFIRLLPHMQVVEDLTIRLIFGDENYSFIKSEMVKEEPAEKVANILYLIQRVISHLSVAMLMEESGADISEKGLYFEGKMQNMLSDTVRQPAETERVANLVKRERGIGESYLLQLKGYLKYHAQEWGGYEAPVVGFHNRDNTGKKTFWA